MLLVLAEADITVFCAVIALITVLMMCSLTCTSDFSLTRLLVVVGRIHGPAGLLFPFFSIEFNFTLVADAGNLAFRELIVCAIGGGAMGTCAGAGGNEVEVGFNAFNVETNAAFDASSFARTDITCFKPAGFLT